MKAEARGSADPGSIFAALGNRAGLELLTTLSDGRVRSITLLSNDVRMARQAVTKHLRVENAGLVI